MNSSKSNIDSAIGGGSVVSGYLIAKVQVDNTTNSIGGPTSGGESGTTTSTNGVARGSEPFKTGGYVSAIIPRPWLILPPSLRSAGSSSAQSWLARLHFYELLQYLVRNEPRFLHHYIALRSELEHEDGAVGYGWEYWHFVNDKRSRRGLILRGMFVTRSILKLNAYSSAPKQYSPRVRIFFLLTFRRGIIVR